jgi:diguanylate cyclase (GGDEF)-like protein
MSDDTKAILRVALLLVVGLGPALAALVVTPTREAALAAAGNAAMAIAFVRWTQRLTGETHHLRLRAGALQNDVHTLEESLEGQARELREARTHDGGTGVLNRSAFLRRLEETIARDGRLGKSAAFLLVDVEGFKAINIEKGRLGGDAVLKRVAQSLADATRGSDCVGRLGGDEFGLVLNECDDPGPAVNRIFRSLQSAAGGDGEAPIQVAIGAVTIEDPAAGVEQSELFRLAEGALASVRGTGGSLCARRSLSRAAGKQATSA